MAMSAPRAAPHVTVTFTGTTCKAVWENPCCMSHLPALRRLFCRDFPCPPTPSMSRWIGILTLYSGWKALSERIPDRSDDADIFRDTHQIEWLIGAGTNGFGAIVRRDDYLFQAPQSFYSKPKSGGLRPAMNSIDLGFNRPIQAGCIFCHSGRPRPIADTNGKFDSTPFSELAIGCENCHGPGAAHICGDEELACQEQNRPAHRESCSPHSISGGQHLHGLSSDGGCARVKARQDLSGLSIPESRWTTRCRS